MSSKENNTNYYKSVYLNYAPMLIRFAEKFVSDFYAEDIVHDVFLKLWDRQIFLLSEKELKQILYVVVRNACIDKLRRESIEKEIIDKQAFQLKLDELDYFDGSEHLFMRNDLFNLLINKSEQLPKRTREIFRLSYIEGMKAKEIADKLDISVRTVENQLYRAIIYLKKHSSSLFYYFFLLI